MGQCKNIFVDIHFASVRNCFYLRSSFSMFDMVFSFDFTSSEPISYSILLLLVLSLG